LFPRVPAYTLVALLAWISLALLYRGYKLYRKGKSAGTKINEKSP
jgi:hypothetical protein